MIYIKAVIFMLSILFSLGYIEKLLFDVFSRKREPESGGLMFLAIIAWSTFYYLNQLK